MAKDGPVRKYIIEVGWSGIALVVCAFALLPTVLTGYAIYAPIVYLMILLVGSIEILLFSLLSAIIDHFAWKVAVYALVVAANVGVFGGMLWFDARQYGSDATNIGGLLIIQLLFIFPIFYLLLRRDLAPHFWRIVPQTDE